MVDVLSNVLPVMMWQDQEEDINISKTMYYVKSGKKSTFAQSGKNKPRTVHRYLWQLNWPIYWQWVIHRNYKQNGSKYHKLVLPIEYKVPAMAMLQEQHHLVAECMLVLYKNNCIGTHYSRMVKIGQKIVGGIQLLKVHVQIWTHNRNK